MLLPSGTFLKIASLFVVSSPGLFLSFLSQELAKLLVDFLWWYMYLHTVPSYLLIKAIMVSLYI